MRTPFYQLLMVLLFCGNFYAQESEEFQEYDIFNQIITQVCDSNEISIKNVEGAMFRHEVVEPRVWSYGHFIFPLQYTIKRELIKDTIVIVCNTETDTSNKSTLISLLKYHKEEELLSEVSKEFSNKWINLDKLYYGEKVIFLTQKTKKSNHYNRASIYFSDIITNKEKNKAVLFFGYGSLEIFKRILAWGDSWGTIFLLEKINNKWRIKSRHWIWVT